MFQALIGESILSTQQSKKIVSKSSVKVVQDEKVFFALRATIFFIIFLRCQITILKVHNVDKKRKTALETIFSNQGKT